jgi:23S rRNA (uracil1939-C5)-methyltransferase
VNPALAICPVQEACGGCPLMALSADEQRVHKLALLERALGEQGVAAPRPQFVPAPATTGYRNRIRLKLEAGRVRFFNEQKEASCAVLEPGLRARLAELIALARSEPRLLLPFAQLELRSDDARARPGLALAGSDDARAAFDDVGRALPGYVVGLRGDARIAAQERRFDGGFALVPLDAFWQINDAVNQALVRHVLDSARAAGAERVLDLYAGAGNFALPLAARGHVVSAVELHAPAVAALERAARAQGWSCDAHAESAERALERFVHERRSFELVIIDAPRAGARAVVSPVVALEPAHVLVCSCNPHSFARDVAALCGAGYRVESLCAFDMFPHTAHLEVVAGLSRSSLAASTSGAA